MSHASAHPTASSVESQALLADLLEQVQSGQPLTSATILETVLNLLMKAERAAHLSTQTQDKGNGFYTRKLGTPAGELDLRVPRDRDGDFRPRILPALRQRDSDERFPLLEELAVNGYSPNQIQRTLNGLNLHYNPEELALLKERYREEAHGWQHRQLDSDYLALFIDAYHAHTCIEGKVQKSSTFVILGINWQGHKELIGIYHFIGGENKTYWLQTLNQIIARGLKKPLYIVSDDFSGLKEAIHTLFPQSFHQLCFVHLQRNVKRNMGKEDAAQMNQSLSQLKLVSDFEIALGRFNTTCDEFEKKYPHFIEHIRLRGSHYLAFLHVPIEVRKFLYTTNAVESFNSTLEKIRQRLGGFFQNQEVLNINIHLHYQRLKEDKWSKGVPFIKARLYELRPLYVRQFGHLPLGSDVVESFPAQAS